MKISALIFDLDGVIVDTAKFHYLAWKQLAKQLGFDFTQKDNERLKGVSRMKSLEILLEIGGLKKSQQEKQHLAQIKNNIYRSFIMTLTEKDILPGVMNFLNQAKDYGFKLSLASASKNTPLILERIGLENFFDAVIDGNKVSKAKPEPDIFLTAAEELEVAPHQCVVFEDAIAGIEAAHRAGMKAIGVGDKEILNKADFVIDSFVSFSVENLLAIID